MSQISRGVRKRFRIICLVIGAFALAMSALVLPIAALAQGPTPTPSPTPTSTLAPTPTAKATPAATATDTPKASAVVTPKVTQKATKTVAPSPKPTSTPTPPKGRPGVDVVYKCGKTVQIHYTPGTLNGATYDNEIFVVTQSGEHSLGNGGYESKYGDDYSAARPISSYLSSSEKTYNVEVNGIDTWEGVDYSFTGIPVSCATSSPTPTATPSPTATPTVTPTPTPTVTPSPTCVDGSKAVLTETYSKNVGTVTLTGQRSLCKPLHVLAVWRDSLTPPNSFPQGNLQQGTELIVTNPGTYNYAGPTGTCGQGDVYVEYGKTPRVEDRLNGPGNPYEAPFLSSVATGPVTYYTDQTGCSTPTPTPTQTVTPSPTATPTDTPTDTPTPTPTVTPSDTPTATPSPTVTPTGTPSPSPTVTPTVTPSPTDTPTPSPTVTPTPSYKTLSVKQFCDRVEFTNPNKITVQLEIFTLEQSEPDLVRQVGPGATVVVKNSKATPPYDWIVVDTQGEPLGVDGGSVVAVPACVTHSPTPTHTATPTTPAPSPSVPGHPTTRPDAGVTSGSSGPSSLTLIGAMMLAIAAGILVLRRRRNGAHRASR